MKGFVQFDGSSSEAFDIQNGVKQGCVLAKTLFGISFAVMLKLAFETLTDGVYLHTRSDWKMYSLFRLKVRTKIHMQHWQPLRRTAAELHGRLLAYTSGLQPHRQSEKKNIVKGQGIEQTSSNNYQSL